MKSESFVGLVSATLNEKGNVLDLIDTINAATKDFPHELSIVDVTVRMIPSRNWRGWR